jgi:hypothetical protein
VVEREREREIRAAEGREKTWRGTLVHL